MTPFLFPSIVSLGHRLRKWNIPPNAGVENEKGGETKTNEEMILWLLC